MKYSVNIAETANGTVSSDKQSAAKGETVTLTVTPANGYLVKSVKVNGSAVEAAGGVYSFVMPAKDVNVEAVFEKIPKTSTKLLFCLLKTVPLLLTSRLPPKERPLL